ncbi:transglycosylase SLT domain-containing protein [Solilutibacter silvestris]|uniref:lytic transglycosylase domain-containing protein n=1 Tax=Solilutibacter silvestris TaxID=1645665 RepID=UPI003D3487C1
MSGDVIKEFLVGLGFKVDKQGERQFLEGIKSATDHVNTLGNTVKAIAGGAAVAGVAAWLKNMASGMEDLYYEAQRGNTTVKNLQAFGYAASQMGSSAEAGRAAVANLANWMRTHPGGEAWLQGLGIVTRDPKTGAMRDTTEILDDFGRSLKQRDPALRQALANQIGLDLPTMNALMEGMGKFEQQYKDKVSASGGDPDKEAEKAHKGMVALRDFWSTLANVGQRVAGALLSPEGGGGALKKFEDLVLTHVPQITKLVEKLANVAIKAFEWVLGQDPDKIVMGLTAIGGALALLIGANMLSGVVTLVSALTSLAGAIGGVGAAAGLAATAAAVLAAGAGGAYVGNKIYNSTIKGTAADDWIGRTVAKGLAFFGNSDAQKALDNEAAANAPIGQSPRGTASRGSAGINPQALFANLERQYGLPAGLLDAEWGAESARGKNMRSSAGALGHFQFMPKSAKAWGVRNPFDLQDSATGAAKYLQYLLKMFGGDVRLATMAYNAGEGRMQDYLKGKGKPLMPETMNYFNRVKKNWRTGTQGAGLQASTVINVNGAGDPMAVAKNVAGLQVDAHKRIQRNMNVAIA